MRYVAFLRGINVGGHKKLPMAELRSMAANVGLTNVATYIQSGNLFVDGDGDAGTVRDTIHQAIVDTFDYDLPVVVRTLDEMKRVVEANPFASHVEDEKHLHVGFLTGEPPAGAACTMQPNALEGEAFAVVGTELFLHLPYGSGKSKLLTHNFAKSLGVDVTVRNWRTVHKAIELLAAV